MVQTKVANLWQDRSLATNHSLVGPDPLGQRPQCVPPPAALLRAQPQLYDSAAVSGYADGRNRRSCAGRLDDMFYAAPSDDAR